MGKFVPSLIEAGADVNMKELKSPLVCAAQLGETNLLTYLIEAGADGNYSDRRGPTPICAAAENGHIDCISRLVM